MKNVEYLRNDHIYLSDMGGIQDLTSTFYKTELKHYLHTCFGFLLPGELSDPDSESEGPSIVENDREEGQAYLVLGNQPCKDLHTKFYNLHEK